MVGLILQGVTKFTWCDLYYMVGLILHGGTYFTWWDLFNMDLLGVSNLKKM